MTRESSENVLQKPFVGKVKTKFRGYRPSSRVVDYPETDVYWSQGVIEQRTVSAQTETDSSLTTIPGGTLGCRPNRNPTRQITDVKTSCHEEIKRTFGKLNTLAAVFRQGGFTSTGKES
jgi:hypothetical protein